MSFRAAAALFLSTAAAVPPVDVAQRVAGFPAGTLWPGFDPARVPLAIFDGQRTWLFRHPSPPAEFGPAPGNSAARLAPGQHPLVRANTSVRIGGVATATLLLDRDDPRPVGELAAIAVHEAFHVHQAQRHPSWGGNEVDLFTYPVDDARLLQLSRLEVDALRRALDAKTDRGATCWAAAALELRAKRFAALGGAGTAYERGTELKEGLARFVESRASRSAEPPLPKHDFPPDDVRSRSYAVGHALAALLGRLTKGWEGRLESDVAARGQGPAQTLDDLLSAAVGAQRGCAFSRAESDQALADAERSVALAAMTREAVRKDFMGRAGWTLVVDAAADPLSPERFDPLNVERLGAGEILHTRWVKLSGPAGGIEVLDRRALTVAAGAHPLFEGVRSVTITGLPAEPEARDAAGTIRVRAPGVSGEFRAARVARGGRTVTVVLPARK